MSDFSHPKRNTTSIVVAFLAALGLLLGWLPFPADAGPPLLQTPRPTLPGGQPGGGPGGGEPGGAPGTTIQGWVVNWNYHAEPHAVVRLRGGGWALETISDDNGYYYFKGLGTDNVFLNLALPEGSGLTPIVTDLALRTKGSGQLVVHLGFYTGPTMPGLPVDITMSAVPESVVPGDTVLYTIQVVNSLPHSLSQVLVTDSLPESLIPVEATVSPFRKTPTPTSTPTNTPTPATPTATPTPGPPTATPRPLPPTATPTPTPLPPTIEIWGNLVIADIGEMAVGDKAVVTIKARVGDNAMPGTVIQNRAYFIYAENVAVQALASLAIGGVLPTGTPTTEVLAVAALPTETPAIAATPTVMATPGTPDGLPVTGFSLPIAGILLALLVLIVRLLRPRPADET